MVDTILVVVAIASVIIWFVQEKIARPQMLSSLDDIIRSGGQLSIEQLENQTSPEWNEWLVKLVMALWVGWIASVVFFGDGDFAFVLVLITLLTGAILALDKLIFASARETYLKTQAVAEYLGRYTAEQKESLKLHFGGDMVVGEWARSFFPVLLVVLILRSFVVEPFQIPSESMVPTLLKGDFILVNKYAYGLRLPVVGTKILEVGEPQRGDIMVFYPPHKDIYYIKRVIGLPGDTLSYKDKQLYINGKEASQLLLAELPPLNPVVQLVSEQLGEKEHLIHKSLTIFREGDDFTVTVKPGHYWMMGDNRDNSSDSRVWGMVPESRIVGEAFAIWMHWPVPKYANLPSFSRVRSLD